LGGGVEIILAEHLHVAAQGHPVEAIFGFAELELIGGGG
jgi:hypothetical protein